MSPLAVSPSEAVNETRGFRPRTAGLSGRIPRVLFCYMSVWKPEPMSSSVSPRWFSRKEVDRHHTKDSCWVLLGNQVYDVTGFLRRHPGGEALILRRSGSDISQEIEGPPHRHSENARRWMEQYYIGELDKDSVRDTQVLPKPTERQHLQRFPGRDPDFNVRFGLKAGCARGFGLKVFVLICALSCVSRLTLEEGTRSAPFTPLCG